MNQFAIVLFDFDGTLCNSFPWFVANINRAAKLFRFRLLVPSDHEKLRSMSTREILRFLEISPWKIPLITFYMRHLMKNSLKSISLFEDVPDLLKELRDSGVQLGIVSSNSESNIRELLGKHSAHISWFACGTSLLGKKEKLKEVASKCQVSLKSIIYIGDEVRDIESAKAVGIKAGGVLWGYATSEALQKAEPDILLKDFYELKSSVLFNPAQLS